MAHDFLTSTSSDDAVKQAIQTVDMERSGLQLGYYTRHRPINIAAGKFFRHGYVMALAGMSNVGKSYFLASLRNDFLTLPDNAEYAKNSVFLHFSYEMKAQEEIIRSVAIKMQRPYDYVISSVYNKQTKDYNRLTDAEFEDFKKYSDVFQNLPIYFFENAGNLTQLYNTVAGYIKKYPNNKFIIAIDHTLLSLKDTEFSDLDLVQSTAQVAMRLKKMGCLVILIHQLNGYIEQMERIKDPNGHYPRKGDLHAGNQIFWACDDIFIYHRPEKLGIIEYGPHKVKTTNLIHLAKIKGRHIQTANVFMRLDPLKGDLVPFEPSTKMKIS